MPVLASIVPDRVAVEPGGTADVALQLQNRGEVVDEFLVEVLGDAAPWITLSRTRVPIFPWQTESVQISLKAPRAPRPLAGVIPVGFRVSSTVDPTQTAVEECRVEVKPFTEIGGEVLPRTARGRFYATHRVRVSNRGNAPVSVTLRAEVQQGDCEVSIPHPTMELAAGERSMSKVKVRPTSTHLRGAEEFHQYKFILEPQGGAPISLDATMRQRPIAQIPTAIMLAAALFLGGAYVAYGRGQNPLATAFRPPWSGPVDVIPTASPTPVPATPTPPVVFSPPPTQAAAAPPPPPPCVPGAPTNVVATAGNATATVTWSAAASSCGPPISSYTIYGSPGNLTAVLSTPGQALTMTVSNLINGTAYTFRATAANSNGTGPQSSPSNAVTPATVPGLPLNVQPVAGDTTATVNWSPPASNGGSPITGYRVMASPLLGNGTPGQAVVGGNTNAATVTGLTNGTGYLIQVVAMNAVGYGPAAFNGNGVTPQCVAINSATLNFHWTGLNATLTWNSAGDCSPFSGAIDCTYQAVNAQGQPAGSGTVHATFASASGSTVVTSASYFNCSMTIKDGKGNAATISASGSIPH